jgi:hypothetical protein
MLFPDVVYKQTGTQESFQNQDFTLHLTENNKTLSNEDHSVSINNNMDSSMPLALIALVDYRQVSTGESYNMFYEIGSKKRDSLPIGFNKHTHEGINELLVISIDNPFTTLEYRDQEKNKINPISTKVRASNRIIYIKK